MWAPILSGLGAGLLSASVALMINRAQRLAAMEARITTRLDRIDTDLNGLARKLAGIESIVNMLLDHPERFVERRTRG